VTILVHNRGNLKVATEGLARMETFIMNICSKFGYNKVVLHTMKIILPICEICMRRQWVVLCICWSISENQVAWFLLVNYQMDPMGLCIQRWTICYFTHFGLVLHWNRYESLELMTKMTNCILACCP
jgi:hypothetical protein